MNQDKMVSSKEAAGHMFIYFSHLMDKDVLDKDRKLVGTIYDIVVKPAEVYPQSHLLIIRKGFPDRKYAVINWLGILKIDIDGAELKIGNIEIAFSQIHNNKEELTLRRDILDQQVVDTYNHKVIRVNDIHLLCVDHSFMIAHVDISTRGLMRRLGFEKFIDCLIGLFNKDASYLKKEYLISWKSIQPLSINPVSMTIKVNIPYKQFASIPAADLGEIFQDLNINHQVALFKSLDVNTKAKIFVNVDVKKQKSLIEELSDKEVVEILNNIPSDEVIDFLDNLPKNRINEILGLMESKYSKRLSQLLGYSSDSAGGLMTTEYIAFTKGVTIETALKQIKERSFKTEPAQFVYILDESGRLIGSTNFRQLILANPQDAIEKAAFAKIYFVHLNSSVKEIAYLMEKYKYYAIAVVDENNVFQGIITVDDILSQVISIAWRRFKKIKALSKQWAKI